MPLLVQQVECAKQLSPDVVASLSKDELKAALVVVCETGTPLPLILRSTLVSMKVGEVLEQADHDKRHLPEALRRIKPWVPSSEAPPAFDALDTSTRTLDALSDLSEQATLQWFPDTSSQDLFLPMLARGAEKVRYVFEVASSFLTAWEDENWKPRPHRLDVGVHCVGATMLASAASSRER